MSPSIRALRSLSFVGIFSSSSFAHPEPACAVVQDQRPRLAWVKGAVGLALVLILSASCAALVLSATPASAQGGSVPVNGCLLGGGWGWARDVQASATWSSGGHNGCGKYELTSRRAAQSVYPDVIYSMPIRVGAGAVLTFWGNTPPPDGGLDVTLTVHNLDTAAAINVPLPAVPTDYEWHLVQADFSAFKGQRVSLEFAYPQYFLPVFYISDISVSNSTNVAAAAPNAVNGRLDWNPSSWWQIGGSQLTFDGNTGHTGLGSLSVGVNPADAAINSNTFPFVADSQTWTLWTKGNNLATSAGVWVRVLDYGSVGVQGSNMTTIYNVSGQNIANTWTSYTVNPSAFAGHTISLMIAILAPGVGSGYSAWLDDVCPAGGCASSRPAPLKISGRVPYNGCFEGSDAGWARRDSLQGTWYATGHGSCGSHFLLSSWHGSYAWPDAVYSLPVLVGPSSVLSFYAKTAGGSARLTVHDLSAGTASAVIFFAVPGDSNWHNFTQSLSAYQGHRVILEFSYAEYAAPGLYLSDVSVTPDASNATDFYPSGFINGDVELNQALWWATKDEDDGNPAPLTFDGGVGHTAPGSLNYTARVDFAASNRVTYPFVADNQTYTFWLRGGSNFTWARIRVRVLDFGYQGMQGTGTNWRTIYDVSGQDLHDTWKSYTVDTTAYAGHVISLMVTVGGPDTAGPYISWLDDVCPASGCPPPLPASLIYSTADCPDACINVAGKKDNATGTVAKPINTLTGGEDYSNVDLSFPALGGPMTFQRSYSSLALDKYTATPMGYGWTHNLDTRLILPGSPGGVAGQVLFKAHSANQLIFYDNGDGTYQPFGGILATLVATASPAGYRITTADQAVYSFDTTGTLLTWADAQGHQWTYSYTSGRLTRVQDNGTPARFLSLGYDNKGKLTSVTDPLNRTVQYGYSTKGDLTTYIDARGKTWTYGYDGTTHRLTQVTDPLGNIVERTEYDTQGRAVRQFDAFNVKTLDIQFNVNNTRVITDAVGSVITQTYNYRDTLASVQNAAGTARKILDTNFRPFQTTDANNHTTNLIWSGDGADLTQVSDALGRTTSLSYDSLNNLTRTVDALGRTSNFTYNGRLLTSSTDDLGNTTLYTYTVEGFLQAQSDARGNTTSYTYNPFGQRATVTDALNHVTRYDYDLVGRLITTTDALQHQTVNAYDNADHLTQVTQNYLTGQPQNHNNEYNIITQYGYDNVGRQTLITNTLNYVTKNDYDAAGRLIRVTQNYDPGKSQNDYNIVTQYGYDNAGHQTYITDTLGYVTRNQYNPAGRLLKTTVNYQDGVFNPAEPDRDLVTTYDYDAAGNVKSKTDTLNRQTRTGYDELSRPMTVTVNYVDGVYNAAEPDRDLRTVTTYDEVGNVQTTTDPLGHVTRTDYDRLNRPSKVAVNYVDGVYNPAEPDKDLVTLQHYDSVGNRDLVTNTLGYETQTEYDVLNRTYRVTQNPLAGQPQNYQNEYNIVTQYGYNEVGSRLTTTDTAGRVTRNVYDDLNRVESVTANYVQGAPADWQTNVTTSYTYDPLGNRKTATDPLTHATSWDYDALSRVLTETRPLANVTTYAYDPRGNRIRVTDPRQHSTFYGYDGLSRNTLITDTLNQVTRYVYDAGGRRTAQTDPLSHSTSYGYDLADRQTTITDTLTHVTRYGYDGLGNRVKLTDARNVITAYWYDAANRLKGVIENYVQGGGSDQQTNVSTEYSYDGLGNRTQIHDAKGHDTNLTYDRLNRVQTEADALSHTTTYHYYPTGPRSMVQDAKNQQTLYTYDNLDRLKQTIYSADGTSEQFGYDAVGNRKVMTDTVGVTQYSYDDLNRLRQVIDPFNQTVGYDYDAAGNRTLITYPDTKQVTYTYTPLNRLESVRDWSNQWTYYGYDAASRPLTATLPNGVSTSYSYDNANRLTRLSHTTGGGSVTLGDYQFAVDAMGNRTAITETVQLPGLGGAMRVVSGTLQIMLPWVSNGGQPTIQSTQNPILLPFVSNGSGGVGPSEWRPLLPLDPLRREPARAPTVALPTPNKTAAPKTAAPSKTAAPTKTGTAPQPTTPANVVTPLDKLRVGDLNPREQARFGVLPKALASLTDTTTISYSYDPLSRVTGASYSGTLTNTFGYTYDAVGNRLSHNASGTVISYTYDIANRLTNVNGVTYTWDDNGNLLNDGAQTYTYDQANRLKQVTQGAITYTFAYNGVGDRLSQTVGVTTTRYVLDPGAGLTQVLADGTNTYLYGNARLGQYQTAMQYFGADGLGSVRQLYDASGQVVGSTRYDPYGNLMSQSGAASSAYGFTGEQQDATGLTYLRARYYSSAQGRFTTRDVWEGDPNAPMSYDAWLYAYANSVNLSDPSGKIPTSPPNRPGATGCPDWFLCEFFRSQGILLPGCDAVTPAPPVVPTPTPKVAYAVPKSVVNDARIREAWGWLKETRVSEPETGIELADAYSNFAGTVAWGSFSEERHDCSGSARVGGSVTVSAIDVDNRFDDEARRTGYTAIILGHEAVHIINPYRACRGSLYEEFHAYQLEEQVNQKILTTRSVLVQPSNDMGQYDPLTRASLMLFFDRNHPEYRDMVTNKQIDEYPPGIVPRP